jgi:hypothetical protein
MHKKTSHQYAFTAKKMEESQVPTIPALHFSCLVACMTAALHFSCLVACMTANHIQMNDFLFVSCLCYRNETIYYFTGYCKICVKECW